MMELKTCAFIVTLVGLVTASPYGYGVKSGAGAAARADSSAIAGAGSRGDVPDVPFGNGFSGSFSKSSSSSSSSSSASSSSSSSAFSYSGSGAGGLSSSGANGNAGCSFGNCQNTGANQISGSHDSVGAGGGYNGASSGAVAGSNVATVSGANCQGASCNNNPEKCTSGQCSTNLLTDTSLTSLDSSIKCNSGQCGSSIQSGPSASHYGTSDDIKFVAHSSKSDHASKDLSLDYVKKPGYTAGSECSGGNCGLSTSYNTPPIFSHGSHNSDHSIKPTNNQRPAVSNYGVTSGYNSPATHLEAPKETTNCKSGTCNPGQSEPGYGSAPSSYNVPIHSSYDNTKQKPSCTDGKCEYPQKGSYPSTTSNSLSTNYLTPQDLHPVPASGSIHTGPSGAYNNKPTFAGAPTGCSSPGCTGHISSPGPNPLSTYNSVKPSASGENLPTYTGGFGGPAGMLKPNEFTIPTLSKPNHSPSSTYNAPPAITTGCKTPNCIGSSPGSAITTQSGSYGIHKESGGGTITNDKLPTYTGSFGGPSGMLKPNDFDLKETNKPKPSSPSAAGCTSPNCSPYTPVAGATSIANAQSGSYGSTKPNAGADSSSELPPYTGSFGGPPGFLQPIGYNTPHSSNNSPYPGPNKVTSSYEAGCTTSSCTSSIAKPLNPHSSIGAPKPSTPSSSITFPGYMSNYRPPIGVTNPSAPAVAPISTSYAQPLYPTTSGADANVPSGPYGNPAACKTGNCGAYTPTGPGVNVPSLNPNVPPKPFGSYGNSAECKTGNCATYSSTGPDVNAPSTNANAPSKPPGSYGNSAECKTGNCGANPPTGFNFNAPSKPSGSYGNSAECKTGNCGANPPAGFNFNAPSKPSGSYGNAAECKSGNCGVNPTTGFNFNTPSKQPGSYGNSAECKTGNCGAHPSTGLNFNAPSKSPGSYGNSAECKTGNCGVNPPTGFNFNTPSKPSGSYGNSVECKNGNCGAYSPTVFNFDAPSYNPNAPSNPSYGSPLECKNGNCGTNLPTGPESSSANPNVVSKPSGSYGDSTGCKGINCDAYPSTGGDLNKPAVSYGNSGECKTGNCGGSYGATKPNTATKPSEFYENTPGCKTGNCATYPSSGSDVNPQSGSYGVTNPHTNPKPTSPQYTGGFGGPSGIMKPNDQTLNAPIGGGCKTPGCTNQASANAVAASQSGSYSGSKQQLPAYTGGFGAPSGLLKPSEYSNPSPSSPTSNKPSSSASPAVSCTSGYCNPKGPLSPGHDVSLSGTQATASTSASDNTAVYTGGFGGPPGFLQPYDNGKVDFAKLSSGQSQGSHYGEANFNFPHGSKPGIHGSGTTVGTDVAGLTKTDASGGSAGGATAYSGSVAGANSGSYGYNTHGAHQAENGGCGGGCAGGYQGSGSSSGAAAKSLTNAGAYGGSYASSSASAHASAGAYTKRGYGKR